MAKDRLSDKLAVILHADVAGSTALVQQDEHLAHERIRQTFGRFSDYIEKYKGRVLEFRGDALLAEFERPSDAVTAALAFQADHTYYLSRLKDDLKPAIRVGIALGEVVVADNTVTGSGVVLAQRVEQLADAGGVCITAALHEAIPRRMPFDLEDLGEQTLKGFEDPVHVYRVELSPGESIPSPPQEHKPERSAKSGRLKIALAVVLVAVVAGTVYWLLPQEIMEEPASVERMAFPLPDKPSIAVLPFTNLSDDVQQDYFADGMTEDLITDISKLNGLFVIARNSVFTYKGKSVKVRQVAEELGVRYVMEGSVRRVGNQVRINAQLIDATSGGHIWAERYDGTLDDIFSMQDKITQSIVTALAVTLTDQEQVNLVQVETKSSQAYDLFLQGWEHYRKTTPGDYTRAISHFEQAVELDPDYARAHSALAAVHWNIVSKGWWHKILGLTATQAIEQTRLYLNKAMENPTALAHQIASERAASFRKNPDQAIAEAERAIALDNNDPAGQLAMSTALLKADRAADALDSLRTAMRLDPHYPASYLTRLGQVFFALAEYKEAAETLEQSIYRNPQDDRAYIFLAATYGHLDRKQDAATAISSANALRLNTGWSDLTLGDITNWKWMGDRKKLREGLVLAGVSSGKAWYSRITRKGNRVDIEGVTKINLDTAKQLHDFGIPFIDISKLYSHGHIPGAISLVWYRGSKSQLIPREFNEVRLSEIVEKINGFVYYAQTRSDHEAAIYAGAYAAEHGFEKVYYFEGGIEAWKAAGYPIETGN